MTNFCLTATIFAFHNELIWLAYADFERLGHGKSVIIMCAGIRP
jgi:hypothetical protein